MQSLTSQKLFTTASTFDSVAQNSVNPFLHSGFKTEVPDPDLDQSTSTDISDEIDN